MASRRVPRFPRYYGRVRRVLLPAFLGGETDNTSIATSTLTSSASSFVAGGAGVTQTSTGRDAEGNVIEGYTPTVETEVV